MKAVSGMTDVAGFPIDEIDVVVGATITAEKTDDLEALKWCARRVRWLYEQSEISSSDTYASVPKLFNAAWRSILAIDPPPASIAAIVDPDQPEPETEEG